MFLESTHRHSIQTKSKKRMTYPFYILHEFMRLNRFIVYLNTRLGGFTFLTDFQSLHIDDFRLLILEPNSPPP